MTLDNSGLVSAVDAGGDNLIAPIVLSTPILAAYSGASFAADLVYFAGQERIFYAHQVKRFDEDPNSSFARMANVAPTSATTGFLSWCQRNDYFGDAEQALRLVAADLVVNKDNGSAVLGATRLIAEDEDWDIGDPVGTGTGRGKEFHPVTIKITGHGANNGKLLYLWNHLVSADGRDDTGACSLDIHYALSDDDFASPPTPIVAFESADVYTYTGLTPPTYEGPTFAPGNNIIQLPSSSQWAGRIVAVVDVIADNNWAPLLIYSDDIAAGWTLGGFVVPTGVEFWGETSIAYDPTTDDIVTVTRLNQMIGTPPTATTPLGRGVARSSDGGATLVNEGINTYLALSNCATAFVQTASDESGNSRFLVGCSTSSTFGRRDEFAIYICYDGMTPSAIYRPFPPNFNIGYCQMVMPDSDTVWLIFETFDGIGQINTADNLCIAVFSMAEIILGAEAL